MTLTSASPHPPARVTWRGMLALAALFLTTRAVLLVVAATAPQTNPSPVPWLSVPQVRWDGGHYLSILKNGYPPVINSVVAFFPGYPLAAWPLAQVLHPEIALVVTSHVTALAACLLLYGWAVPRIGSAATLAGMALLLCYPPAMFFSVAYAEGVFFLAIALAVHFTAAGRDAPAALAAGYATLTRPTGLVVALLVWCCAIARGAPLRRAAWLLLLGVFACGGILGYELYLWGTYGRADAYFAAQETWKPVEDSRYWYHVATLRPIIKPALTPLRVIAKGQFDLLLDPWTWNTFWNVALLTLACLGLWRPGGMPRVWFWLPILQFLMGWAQDPANGARLVGIARYQLVAFPCFLWLGAALATRRRGWLLILICAAMFALQAIYLRLFCNWVLVS